MALRFRDLTHCLACLCFQVDAVADGGLRRMSNVANKSGAQKTMANLR